MKKRWQQEENNRIKINVDGAFLPILTQRGLGGVVRGSQGQFIAAFAHSIQHVCFTKHVELLAIREGIDLAQQMQMSQVSIESNYLAAVQTIAHSDSSFSDFGNISDDIQEDLRGPQGVQINFAPRTYNQVAHRLENIGFESGQNEAWFIQAPSCISDLPQHDWALDVTRIIGLGVGLYNIVVTSSHIFYMLKGWRNSQDIFSSQYGSYSS
ncbi:uncharacterized protein LOC133716197 [Rosa rugosa]|uniref:uncharacterized protein LOC133716197 n=1 Tax=Rosa rugosa TaxID=74645 RepID=UPI002B40E006|nr:uncharacterized protein LOC133716197 [Rosa rugosa]